MKQFWITFFGSIAGVVVGAVLAGFAFFALIALNCLVQALVEWRIRAADDSTPVKTPLNPMAMLMGGGAGSKNEQTAAEYDRAQLGSMRNSYRMGVLFSASLTH